jgi:hypothetical protein
MQIKEYAMKVTPRVTDLPFAKAHKAIKDPFES